MPSPKPALHKHKFTLLLILLSLMGGLALFIAPAFPYYIEHYYALGINRCYRQALSRFFDLFPFSFYEFLLYGVILTFAACTLWRLMMSFIKPHTWQKNLAKWFLHTLDLCLLIWIIFVFAWDISYSRLPLEKTMQLDISQNCNKDLESLYRFIISRLNDLSDQVSRDANGYMITPGGYKDVFSRTQACYDTLSSTYAFLGGNLGHPKPILLSKPMLYTGITGIYSPFTSEANVNVAILPQSLPATALHEMAHQRGFAQEDECNFLAFLACSVSDDADFQYSGYMLALAYTSQALRRNDPDTLKALNKTLNASVLHDVQHHNAFWDQFEGKVEKISSTLNDSYLKANGIADGEASYGRMVDLLTAYYRTHLV